MLLKENAYHILQSTNNAKFMRVSMTYECRIGNRLMPFGTFVCKGGTTTYNKRC